MLMMLMLALSSVGWGAPPESSDVVTTGGTYTKVLPAGASTDAYWSGGIRWTYVGQQEYSVEHVPHEPYNFDREPSPASERTLTEKIVGTIRIDGLGRRWVATEVDEGVLQGKLEAHRSRVRELFGPEPAGPPEIADSLEDEEAVPTTEHFIPWSWTWTECGGIPKTVGVWDDEDRDDRNGKLYPAQKKSVLMFLNTGSQENPNWGTWCNGTIVDPQRVLTAGHCVHDGNGNELDEQDLKVCTYGNRYSPATCQGVDDIFVNPDYNPNATDTADDYAVLDISGLLGVGWMALSSASDSVIESNPIHRTSRPGRNPETPGSPCTVDPVTSPGTNPPMPGGRVFWQVGEITSTPSKKVCSHHDGSAGESGSAFYYFPGGCSGYGCTGSHYLVGILVGPRTCNSNPFSWFTGGPKARDFKDWVESTFP